MHLHLTGVPTDDELLLLMQFPAAVVFLEVNTHAIFRLRSASAHLRRQHWASLHETLEKFMRAMPKQSTW